MSTNIRPGDRVGAISHAYDGTVYLFGYGTYQGDSTPPPEVEFLGLSVADRWRKTNPKIILDNGETIWGCECWWGPEAEVQEKAKGQTVVIVSVPERTLS